MHKGEEYIPAGYVMVKEIDESTVPSRKNKYKVESVGDKEFDADFWMSQYEMTMAVGNSWGDYNYLIGAIQCLIQAIRENEKTIIRKYCD